MDKGVAMKEKTNRYEKKKTAIFLLVFFLFSIFTIVLGILCLQGVYEKLSRTAFFRFSMLILLGVSLVCGVCVWCVLTGKERTIKILLSVYFLLVFSLLVLLILQRTDFFEVIKSSESLQEYLARSGVWMPTLYILLQFLQVIVLPIPSVVSTLAGVALFGAFWATIYSLIGIIFGSVVAFFIGKKLGGKAVAWMVGEDSLKKWQKKLKGKDNLILTLAFALPLFPDDILCFLAGLSTMTTKYFLVMVTICRALGIVGTCYSVDLIPFNTWWGIAIWIGLALITVFAFVIIYKNLDKIQKKIRARRKENFKNPPF